MIQHKAKEKIISLVKESAEKHFSGGLNEQLVADLKRLVSTFYETASLEDLEETDPVRLAAIAHSFWRLSRDRKPGTPTIRIFNPDLKRDGWKNYRTIVEIINDDMPFLVDSITGTLSQLKGYKIHFLHHPLFVVERDDKGRRIKTVGPYKPQKGKKEPKGRESFIYVEIDPVTDPKAVNALENQIFRTLSDVRNAVQDWRAMLDKGTETKAELERMATGKDKALYLEAEAFLNWLVKDNFTFLGYREYKFEGSGKKRSAVQDKTSGLGILKDPRRHVMRSPKGMTSETEEVRDFLFHDRPMLVTKTNVRTTVHRPVHMDYVSVKKYNEKGEAVGERQFVGLFTSKSYLESPREVPILRKKVKSVLKKAPYAPDSHAGKAITHILETFPRDEMFLISEKKLLETALGVLHLTERPRPRAFIREDKYKRYISAIVYVPRESYHSGLREKIEKILCKAYQGEVSVYYAKLSEDVLARWHFMIRTKPDSFPKVDQKEINAKIYKASRPWDEGLRKTLMDAFGENRGLELYDKYANLFSEDYRAAFKPKQALTDIRNFEEFDVHRDVSFEVFRDDGDPDYAIRLHIYHPSRLISLSEVLPMLENLGVRVISENSYGLRTKEGGKIHAFYLETPNRGAVNIDRTEKLVEPLLTRVWQKQVESDYFNALAIHAGLECQDIVVLRAYSRYLRQLGISYSEALIKKCLFQHPKISRRLVKLFHVMFEPGKIKMDDRKAEAEKIVKDIKTHLNKITSLDHDRIFRMYLSAILATVRTNFFTDEFIPCHLPQTSKEAAEAVPALALKINTGAIPEAPKPRPFREIFVYSPRVEGVHLRGGPVARGGIRWSDRREDFRTEVLGLMKAQQVKNAVIVPVGAKGGFYPKKISPTATREEYLAEGLSCYRIFIRSLLTVTDNRKDHRIVPPEKVVRWDNDDNYFVVAADKGTATFSDVANEISQSVGFWLDDAFASGGSNGYDHKKMAITARGAWVSVERHFREAGVNINKEPISVIGIGDMSGDVFGNGMLLSDKLHLVAAFDHRHIFFDPDPDEAVSFKERKRLFKMKRSSWADYNPDLISKGGGVFDRNAKSIKLNKELQAFLEVDAGELTPDEVIHHILKAKADLLWIGGIGTYVKSAKESHAEVGDRANDDLRVDATELRVKVIGEGGNLGLTQRGRIDFARRGGHINTDFIDNSAGVDCSDKEVNAKILLANAIAKGTLTREQRNKLLADMTEDVADRVLRDNYLQTQAISLAEAEGPIKREQHQALIRQLEREKRIDRALENLPTDEQFSKVALKERGLTRPDLSVLVSYTKLRLKDLLLRSDLLDDDSLKTELRFGFPTKLHKPFAKEMETHPLHREIIATNIANQVVNRAGLTFISEVEEETGLSADQIVSSFIVARDAFGLRKVWHEIDALDYKIPARLQTEMHLQVAHFLRHQAGWFLKHLKRPIKIETGIARYQDSLKKILENPQKVLGPMEQDAYREKWQGYVALNVPQHLAKKIAAFAIMHKICDIVIVANILKRPVEDVGRAYFEIGRELGFDWLRQTSEGLPREDHWEHLAVNSIIDDLADQQRELTKSILERRPKLSGTKAVADWVKTHPRTLRRASRLVNDLKSAGVINVAKLSFAIRHVRSILPRKV